MSLSYFFVRILADGVDSLDSSKLVAEPDDDEYQFRKRKINNIFCCFFLKIEKEKRMIQN